MVAAAVATASPALGADLQGYKGDRLRGSISCVHPNVVQDLIERIVEEANYVFVARVYLQQGYCVEADIPTVLVKPMADHTYRTWDGHDAEIWETVLEVDRADGMREDLRAYSIVFPVEMEQHYSD
jgi:hypothetical protein